MLPEEHWILENLDITGPSCLAAGEVPRNLRQSTEALGRVAHIFYMTVDIDLEVDSRPALLVFSVLQTTSEIPIHVISLSYGPEHRSCGTASSIDWNIGPRTKNLGWNSDDVKVHVDAVGAHLNEATSLEGVMNFHLCLSVASNSLWGALEMKARSPGNFMDVCDEKMSDLQHAIKARTPS